MKRAFITSIGLLIGVGVMLSRRLAAPSVRMLASYFCNLADQSGGGAGNRAACGIFQHADAMSLFLVGTTLLVVAVVVVAGRRHRPR